MFSQREGEPQTDRHRSRGEAAESFVGKMDVIQIAVLKDNTSFLHFISFIAGLILFQFTSWVDAVIFVFSLENETSFNAIYNYYAKMSQYRNMQDIPLILVGTQGEAARETDRRHIQVTFNPFLCSAKRSGLRIVSGRNMTLYQQLEYLDLPASNFFI